MSFLKDGGRRITISSSWGTVYIAEVIIMELNKLHKEVTLYGNQLLSSGFDIFHQFKGDKKLLNWAVGMVHKISIHGVKVDSTGVIAEFDDRRAIKNMKHMKQSEYDFLTNKEKKKYKEGKDVRFSYKRLQKIF